MNMLQKQILLEHFWSHNYDFNSERENQKS